MLSNNRSETLHIQQDIIVLVNPKNDWNSFNRIDWYPPVFFKVIFIIFCHQLNNVTQEEDSS